MKDKDYFSGKRVLVAGASGFVGTHLVKSLVKRGALVRGSYLKRRPSSELTNIDFIKCDFTDYNDCVNATKDIDFVFMAAANTSGAAVIEKSPLAHLTLML